MNNLEKTVLSLHADYERLSGVKLKYNPGHYFRWEMWLSRGWTADDLASVIQHIRRQIESGARKVDALNLSNLIDPDKFATVMSEIPVDTRTHQ